MSACARAFTRRSSSCCTRSRSAWRFCASRIRGAAYAACVEKARFRRMNGYGSHLPKNADDVEGDPDGDDDRLDDQEAGGAERAGDGLGEATERLGVVVDAEGGGPGEASRGPRRRFIPNVSPKPLSPPDRQRPVEHVVDGDDRRAVDARASHTATRHEVVRRESAGHLGVGQVGRRPGVRLRRSGRAPCSAARAAGAGSARRRGRCRSACPTEVGSRRPARRARPASRARGCAASASATVAVARARRDQVFMRPPAVPSP